MTTEQPSRAQLGARFLRNMVVAPALIVGAAILAIWFLRVVGIITVNG